MSLETIEDLYPLSPTQAGMIYHGLAEPEAGVYVGQVCFDLRGDLEPSLMEATWAKLVERHAALRTVFLWEDLEQPLQAVQRQVVLPWQHLDWRALGSERQGDEFERWKRADRTRGFAIDEAPLMRMALIRLADERYWLVWTSHHALADGWSVSVLLREMCAIYRGLERGPAAQLQQPFAYSRYVAWLESQDMAAAESYWRRRLRGFTAATALQTGSPAPAADSGDVHGSITQTLNAGDSAALQQAARSCQVSLYTLLQAAWGILLHRYSGSDDIVFGVTTSGRPAQLGGVQDAVGLFINTLPVRHDFSRERAVADWLRELQADAVEFMSYEFSPLPQVMAWSELPGGTPLFDSILVMTNYPKDYGSGGNASGWSVEAVEVVDYSNYGLALVVTPGEDIELKLVFDGSRFSRALVTQLLSDLEQILVSLAGAGRCRVAEIGPPAAAERARLLADRCRGAPLAPASGNVLDWFAEQHQSRPSHTAVCCGADSLSYAQLDAQAARLATQLNEAGFAAGARVAICLQRGTAAIGAMLGILRAGCAYVPLDPATPAWRLRAIVDDAACELLLTQRSLAALSEGVDCPVVLLDQAPAVIPPAAADPSHRDPALAYVIYTSGSTGKPKGVAVTHANLAYSTQARMAYYRQAPESFLMLSSFAFDSSVAGIYWTLCSGGKLVISEHRLEQDMTRLGALIAQHAITHTLCLPSLYRLILAHIPQWQLASLQCVIVAGETLPGVLLDWHRETAPQARLFNEYGPTEGTVWCTAFDASQWRRASPVPIGRPIPGASIYLLDPRGRLVPPGVVGEICVSGPGVAAGYLGRPEHAGGPFAPDPLSDEPGDRLYRSGDYGRYLDSGEIEFLGRRDEQVKLRGHRIELGEIEAALAQHVDVEEAVVLALEADSSLSAQAPDDGQLEAIIAQLMAMADKTGERILAEIEALSDRELEAALASPPPARDDADQEQY